MRLPCRSGPAVPAGGLSVLVLSVVAAGGVRGSDPWADAVMSYDPGAGPAPGYVTPATALGPPERFTGEGVFPGAVTAFNAPFGTDEIVSIGAGGSLVVRFDEPVVDDPANPYGIDLLVFGNALFVFDGGGVGQPAALFSDPGLIDVSADGTTWVTVPGAVVDDLYPTEGYLDLGDPFATVAGAVPSDFTRPVDPALGLSHFAGHTYAQVLARYRGSGGGAGIDLAPTGMAQASYVRVRVPAGAEFNTEIDAFADVAPRAPGDADYDGVVDVTDLLLVLGGWGVPAPGSPPVDMNGDGVVDVLDLLLVLGHWS